MISALFVLFALLGGGTIIVLRWWGIDSLIVALSGSVIIVLYAAVAVLAKPKALPTGGIGDNCYYLGFIFTLTSLAWSLYSVSDAEGEDFVLEIVSGFGIALLTTAVGVVLRVALNPMRVDIVEEEQAAFQSIRHYYQMMHHDLAALSMTNKQFALGIERSIREFQKSFNRELREEAEMRRAETTKVIGAAETRLVEDLVKLGKSADAQVKGSIDTVSKSGSAGVERAIRDVAEAAKSSVRKAAEDIAGTSQEGIDALRKFTKGTTEDVTGIVAEIETATTATTTAVSDMASRLQEAQAALSTSLEALKTTTDAVTSEVPDRVRTLAESVQKNLATLDAAVKSAAEETQAISERLAAVSQRILDMEAQARRVAPRKFRWRMW